MSPHADPAAATARSTQVVERAGLHRAPGTPARRSLHILETYPRDELLQTPEDELFAHRDRHPAAAGPAAAAPVRAGRPVRPLRRLPRLRAARPLQHGRARADAAPARAGAAAPRESEFQAQLSRVARSPVSCSPCARRTAFPPTSTSPRSSGGWSRPPGAGATGCGTALLDAAARSDGNRLFAAFGRAFPASYQERVDARGAPCPTSWSSTAWPRRRAGDLAHEPLPAPRGPGRAASASS